MPNAPRPHRAPQPRYDRHYERSRGTAAERGYDGQWARESEAELKRQVSESGDPFCRYCGRKAATMMDHIIPPSRLGNRTSEAYRRAHRNPANWMPCCYSKDGPSCNSRKGSKLPHELKGTMREVVAKAMCERGLKADGMCEHQGIVSAATSGR